MTDDDTSDKALPRPTVSGIAEGVLVGAAAAVLAVLVAPVALPSVWAKGVETHGGLGVFFGSAMGVAMIWTFGRNGVRYLGEYRMLRGQHAWRHREPYRLAFLIVVVGVLAGGLMLYRTYQ